MDIMADTRLCLDTDVLIAFLKGREPGASAVEKAVKEYTCFVTAVTAYELLFGVARAKKMIGEDTLLSVMTVVPFDEFSARRAAHLHDELIRKNADIGIKDVMIAAIYLENSLTLLTQNQRHFSRVPSLSLFNADQFSTD